MLVFAAIGVFGAGMLAIAAGIPIKEFGFGNTLILSGVLAWCSSAIMITLWVCFRDLKQGIEQPARRSADAEKPVAEPRTVAPVSIPTSPSGWPESIPERAPPPPAAPPPPEREPRRNVLFASNRRPAREGAAPAESPIAQAPATGPFETRSPPAEEPRPAPRRIESPPPRPVRPVSTVGPRDPVSAPPLPPAPVADAPPREPEPARSPASPSPSSSPIPTPSPSPGRNEAAAVSVLKSGVVDGMAYWLYSDGSIEAQMPEGMMRFTSIDELRAHLDKRP